jgi:membrane protease YdiL (CAAX protease family)
MGDVVYGILLWVTGGVLAAVVLIATGVVDLRTGQLGELSVGAVALSLASGWIGLAGWPVVASYRKGRRSLAADFGLRFAWVDLAWGVGAGFACLAVSVAGNVAWFVLSDEEAPDNAEFLPSNPGLVGGLVLVLLVAVATPVVEELFFRGLFLRSVARRWGPAAGVVVSSVVFGLFHAGGDSLAEAAFIVGVTTVYGAVLGLVATWTGRLGAPIVAHMVVNAVGVGAALLGAG